MNFEDPNQALLINLVIELTDHQVVPTPAWTNFTQPMQIRKNNLPPVFHSPSAVTVVASQPIGRSNPVFYLNATDRDSDPIVYAIVSGATIGEGTPHCSESPRVCPPVGKYRECACVCVRHRHWCRTAQYPAQQHGRVLC